jgi:hypothetical protein
MSTPAVQWNPISRLPEIAGAIDEMLTMAEEQYRTLLAVRERPYVLDDYTVGRVIEVFTAQADDLWLYEEQLRRWQGSELTTTERQDVEEFGGQVVKLRAAITAILALAEELKGGTIERVLEKSDIELALEVLSGKRKR